MKEIDNLTTTSADNNRLFVDVKSMQILRRESNNTSKCFSDRSEQRLYHTATPANSTTSADFNQIFVELNEGNSQLNYNFS